MGSAREQAAQVTSVALQLRSLVLLVLARYAGSTKLPAKANEVIHPRLVPDVVSTSWNNAR